MSKVLAKNCCIFLQRLNTRSITKTSFKSILKPKKKCIIYTTKTINPYQNLAFEDWMYEKVDFTKTSCLFIWRNEPCVVIGRHQNPWKECCIKELINHNVHLCRRNSGGGAVYHDLGNINFTFFTDKENYNRKQNLEIIIEGLQSKWPKLDVSINSRDDIVLKNNKKTFKISGSSAKVGRRNAYHHCTLLLNSNTMNIKKFLIPSLTNLTCNSTESVRSNVANLSEIDESINFEDVCDTVMSSYSNKYESNDKFQIDTNDTSLFSDILKTEEKLKTWDWIFGKTPNFSSKKEFFDGVLGGIEFSLSIEKGFIKNIEIISELKDEITTQTISDLKSQLQNCKFHPTNIQEICDNFSKNDNSYPSTFLLKCIQQLI